jgi:hypothetical protein
MDNIIFGAFGFIIVLLIVYMFWGARKKRWYEVCLANNDILILYRDANERFWRTSDRYLRFKEENGSEITFTTGGHWVLYWREIPESMVAGKKAEIKRMKEETAKGE